MTRSARTVGFLVLFSLSVLGCSAPETPALDGDVDGSGVDGGADADGDVGADADADSSDGDQDGDQDADGDTGEEPPRCRAPLARPLRIFFIGNSFTLGGPIPSLLRDLATSAGWPTPEVELSAYGGYTLQQHRETTSSVDGVDGGGWDFVVLQELSTRPTDNIGDPDRFKEDATWFYDRAQGASASSMVVLYETWARHPDHEIYPGSFADPAEMQAQLRTHYNDAADRYIPEHSASPVTTNVVVAPAGDAWEHHLGAADPLRLHGSDDYHAGSAGQYLNALVIYSTIYGCRAEGLSSLSLSTSDAERLQQSADSITGEVGVPPIDRLSTLQEGETIRVDFGEVTTPETSWNLLTTAGGATEGLVTVDGQRRRVGIAVTDGFEGANDSGLAANDLGWPETVTVDVLWTGSFDGHDAALGAPAELTIRGLEPGAAHRLELFASREGDDGGAGRLTRYVVGSEWVDLDASSNRGDLAVFDSVRPDPAGDVVIGVGVSPAGAGRFAYIGALLLSRL